MIMTKQKFDVITQINGTNVLKHLEMCGRTCYKSESKITEDSYKEFIERIVKKGHDSILEHFSITVNIITDRGVSHELVRHRLASYNQESTRYCMYNRNVTYIIPVWITSIPDEYSCKTIDECTKNLELSQDEILWIQACLESEKSYMNLLNLGWSPEEARTVLPNSLKTEIKVTANLREWKHILTLRGAKGAHPQFRSLAIEILNDFKQRIPIIFDSVTF